MNKRVLWIGCCIFALTLSACGPSSHNGKSPSSAPKKYTFDEKHGREVTMGITPLVGTGSVNANGVAQVSIFKDGVARVSVQLNILEASKGEHYEVWLKDPETGKSISLGKITSPTGDVRHLLRQELNTDPQQYPLVMVTREKDAGGPTLGTIEALGTVTFKKR